MARFDGVGAVLRMVLITGEKNVSNYLGMITGESVFLSVCSNSRDNGVRLWNRLRSGPGSGWSSRSIGILVYGMVAIALMLPSRQSMRHAVSREWDAFALQIRHCITQPDTYVALLVSAKYRKAEAAW